MNEPSDLDHSTILFIQLAEMVANINKYVKPFPHLESARDSFYIALETEFNKLPEEMQDAIRDLGHVTWR